MRDPTVEDDPRFVSAYSVYKGLAKLKSYQDTSGEGASSSKRSKKNARKRNRKKVDAEINVKSSTVAKKEHSADSGTTRSDKQGPSGGQINGADASPSKRKRQKKRNKKKALQLVSASAETSDNDASVNHSVLDSSLYPSDDEEEPPVKSRKTSNNIVPNPLAYKGDGAKGSIGPKKAVGVSISAGAKKQKPCNVGDKNITHTQNGQMNKTPKKPASSAVEAVSQNGSSKAIPTRKKNKKAKNEVSSSTSSGAKTPPYVVTSKVPPLEVKSVFNSARVEDSISHAKSALEWLLHPVSSDEFMKTYWEKKPLLIKRKHSDAIDYYKWILTTQTFDDMLRRHPIKYGVNLDITSYVDGKRETLSENMQGRVRPAVVWDYYNNGCSIRMLNPQTYIQPLWRLNSSLQEWFGSFVGANMYLTPPDSQGFAPHYDDIDAFILQIEGKKRWKLYAARNQEEVLPRFSSRNFSEESDNLGEPILDVVLEEGDLLYFPRGVIHQAQTVDGEHSLHITLSCNQLNTFGDLLKHHLNHALDKLLAKDVNFRKGLPVDYLSFMGIAHENTADNELKKKRKAFSKTVEELVMKLAKEPADFAADAMGKKFIWDSLPPHLNSKERETTVVEDGEFMQNGKVFNRVEFGPETEVKLIRKHCLRLIVEEEQIKLYFATENPLVYHEEEEPQYLEISVELAPAINHLISQYPNYTKIDDLPISSNDTSQTIQLVSDLWERGLLFTKDPLEPCDYDDLESDDSDLEKGEHENDTNGKSGEDEDDIESINLSDLPEENGESDDLCDEFYDTSMMFDSDDQSEDEDDDESQLFLHPDDEENSEDNSSEEGYGYDIDEDEDPDLDDEDEDDDIDFDEMDKMEETDSE